MGSWAVGAFAVSSDLADLLHRMSGADSALANYKTMRSFVGGPSGPTPFAPARRIDQQAGQPETIHPKKTALSLLQKRTVLSAIAGRDHSSGGVTFFAVLPKSPSADAARYANTAYAATFCASAFGSILSSVSSGVWW